VIHRGAVGRADRAAAPVATVGLGLNLRAWVLLGPRLALRSDVGLGQYVLLMGLPVLIAALVRLPVGVVTDRYGARVMFPAVSLAAAAAACGLGFADSLPVVVVAGAAAGAGSSARITAPGPSTPDSRSPSPPSTRA